MDEPRQPVRRRRRRHRGRTRAARTPPRPSAPRRILRGLPHVTDVTAPTGRSTTWHLAVRPATARSQRPDQAILAAAVGNDLRLTSLRPVVPSLDDIYRTALHRRGLADRAIAGGKTAA